MWKLSDGRWVDIGWSLNPKPSIVNNVKVSFSFCCFIILILIIRVLIRGDFSAIFILHFHKIKKKKIYTALSKFWNYNVYHFLYFSNDNKFFLNYFQSHNLAKNILILRVLIRGDFSAIFILYFHLKKKKRSILY